MSASLRPSLALLAATAASLAAASTLTAQERLDRMVGGTGSPTVQSWSFGTAVRQDGVDVTSARQLAVPLAVRIPVGRRLTVEANGAFVQTTVQGTDSAGRSRSASVAGPTDARVRATLRLPGDVAALTAGVNLPLGATALDADQLLAMRTVGAPALRATAPALGVGFGSTLGVVLARRVGTWAIGGAVAAEQRAGYTPFEAALTGAETELRPGNAVHLSLGADGFAGQHRVGLVTGLDLFSQDEVQVRPTGLPAVTSTYTLGPQVASAVSIDVATTRARALRLSAAHRWRGRFTGPEGETVSGSAAHLLDATVDAVLGRPTGVGLLLGAELRYASRLDLDPSFVTAGVSGVGGKVGASIRGNGFTWEPSARLFAGQLSLGSTTSSMTMLTIALSASRQ